MMAGFLGVFVSSWLMTIAELRFRFFQRFDSLQQLRQSFEYRGAFQPDLVLDRGVAGNNLACFHGAWNSGLRGRDDTISDLQMSGDANLSRENDISPDLRAACQSNLRAEQRIFAHIR